MNKEPTPQETMEKVRELTNRPKGDQDSAPYNVTTTEFKRVRAFPEIAQLCEQMYKENERLRGGQKERDKEILTELLERICPKGGTPLDRGHAILELAKLLIELSPESDE